MKTVREFTSAQTFFAHILNQAYSYGIRVIHDVQIEKYGEGIDERIGWDTHIVTVNGQAMGFTDGPGSDIDWKTLL